MKTEPNLIDDVALQMLKAGVSLDDAGIIMQERIIATALREQRGNQCKAARQLHAHRNTLSRKIKLSKYGLAGEVRGIRQALPGSRFARKASRSVPLPAHLKVA
jgi:DNA-binding NtrC family response regulator